MEAATSSTVTFTPDSFQAQLSSLLLRVAHRTVEVRLCYPAVCVTSHVPPGTLEIEAECLEPITSHHDACSETRVHTTWRIRGDVAAIDARWCSMLQRAFSVVSLLLGTTENEEADNDIDDARGDVGVASQTTTAGQPQQAIENEAPKPLFASVRPRWSLSRFSVDLAPLMPPIAWDKAVDGVFGCASAVVKTGTLRLSEAAVTRDLRMARGQSKASGAGDGRVFGVRVAALLNASVPPPTSSSLAALCDAATPARTAACVVLHAPGTALLTAHTSSPSSSSRTQSPCPTFETLNAFTANVLVPRLNIGSVMGASLLTSSSLSSLQRPAAPATAAAASASQTAPHGRRAPIASDVCRVAMLGTSYLLTWPVRAPQRCGGGDAHNADAHGTETGTRTTQAHGSRRRPRRGRDGTAVHRDTQTSRVTPHSTIQNIVFVIDVPLEAWVSVLADTTAEQPQGGGRGAAQIAALMEAALAALVHRNMDVCVLHSQSAAMMSRTDTGTGTTTSSSPSLATQYPRQLLVESIAESIASVLFHSESAAFVHEAERLLFMPTARQMPDSDERTGDGDGGGAAASVCEADDTRGAAERSVRNDDVDDDGNPAAACSSRFAEPSPILHSYTAKQVKEAVEKLLSQ